MQHSGISVTDFRLLRTIIAHLQSELKQVGIFGSRATGRFTQKSDIDIVVRGASPQAVNAFRGALDESALSLPFDVVSYEESDEALRAHIDRFEIIIWPTADDT